MRERIHKSKRQWVEAAPVLNTLSPRQNRSNVVSRRTLQYIGPCISKLEQCPSLTLYWLQNNGHQIPDAEKVTLYKRTTISRSAGAQLIIPDGAA